MKFSKKSQKSVKGPFVSIGSRGVVVNDLKTLEEPLVIGRQPILEKAHGDNHAATELWVRSCSWITSRRNAEKDGKAYFMLLPLSQAIRQKKVALHKGLKFKQGKNSFTATVVSEPGWNPKSGKQPRYLGVVEARGYRYNRIESRLVREADGSASRNRHLVCKLVA